MKRTPGPGTEAPAPRGTSPAARGTRSPRHGRAVYRIDRPGRGCLRARSRSDRERGRARRSGRARACGLVGCSARGGAIQRKCAECQEEEDEKIRRAPKESEGDAAVTDAAVAESSGAESAAAPDAALPETSQDAARSAEPLPGLLVDDDSDAAGGQMRKSEFMAALRAEVCATVDEAFSGTGKGLEWLPVDRSLARLLRGSQLDPDRACASRVRAEGRGGEHRAGLHRCRERACSNQRGDLCPDRPDNWSPRRRPYDGGRRRARRRRRDVLQGAARRRASGASDLGPRSARQWPRYAVRRAVTNGGCLRRGLWRRAPPYRFRRRAGLRSAERARLHRRRARRIRRWGV